MTNQRAQDDLYNIYHEVRDLLAEYGETIPPVVRVNLLKMKEEIRDMIAVIEVRKKETQS